MKDKDKEIKALDKRELVKKLKEKSNSKDILKDV
jgi:hypothetical protein